MGVKYIAMILKVKYSEKADNKFGLTDDVIEKNWIHDQEMNSGSLFFDDDIFIGRIIDGELEIFPSTFKRFRAYKNYNLDVYSIATMVLIHTADNKFLVVKRSSKVLHNPSCYTIPGGYLSNSCSHDLIPDTIDNIKILSTSEVLEEVNVQINNALMMRCLSYAQDIAKRYIHLYFYYRIGLTSDELRSIVVENKEEVDKILFLSWEQICHLSEETISPVLKNIRSSKLFQPEYIDKSILNDIISA